MSKFFLYISILLSLIYSCADNLIENTIVGLWSIDQNQILYKGEDLTFCLNGNTILFEEQCELPVTNDYCPEIVQTSDKSGTYQISTHDKGIRLKFTTNNKLFSGEAIDVFFEKDEKNKLLKMILISKKLYIKCTKALFNYNANQSLIDKLIKLTPPVNHN